MHHAVIAMYCNIVFSAFASVEQCFVMCPPARNCNVNSVSTELCVIFASTELGALCGLIPQAQNCVLNVVSASTELRVLCIVEQILCMQLLICNVIHIVMLYAWLRSIPSPPAGNCA